MCGPETSAWSFTLPSGTESVGVRFRPGSATPLLRISASDLRNTRAELSDLTGSRTSRILLDRLENAPATQRVAVLEDMVRSWNRSTRSPDPVASAVSATLAHHSWSVDAAALRSPSPDSPPSRGTATRLTFHAIAAAFRR
ncbi:DUF6597 domain-containing transcriptional factor [Rhodococcus sp. NPDC056743]|uniref:DUF6597 domain-containing transcriptional factor n=1 Tax=Rhodococcus sp. NPDC056743 TaxID=3345934 RepID=UPI00366EC797